MDEGLTTPFEGDDTMREAMRGPDRFLRLLVPLGALVGSLASAEGARDRALPDRAATHWGPHVEWRLPNPTWEANPFDVDAEATFRHEASGEERSTAMFWAGGGEWRFRFTATRPGEWLLRTRSSDPDLAGWSGRIRVAGAATSSPHGFVTCFGSKWGWQGTGRVFVPQLAMFSGEPASFGDPAEIDRAIEVFLRGHGFNGLHVPSVAGRWFGHDRPSELVDESLRDPDPETFRALERLILRVHAAGGFVHIWMWGDHQRRWTCRSLRGGPDGAVARRLDRYIAARLGPLPGWTMGFGFDLQEWAAVPGRIQLVRPWKERLEGLLGWRHLLGGRMGPTLRGGALDHRVQARLNEGLGYAGFEHHRPTYAVYRAALAAGAGRPVFSEDRFRIRVPPLYPDKDYDEVMTRRGLYHSTLAGGVANIWGNNHPGGWAAGGASRPYPHPEWTRTWATFFADRFVRDMEPASGIVEGPCLARPTRRHYVVYAEETASIEMDLSTMAGACPGVAVDTRAAYREIPLGTLEPGKRVWTAPHASDWVLAIGTFEGE